MKIALVSDEWHPIDAYIEKWIHQHGMEAVLLGSFRSHHDEPWIDVTLEAAKAVATGQADEGIFLCWSGTGSSIVANKVKRIRAALCTEPETAKLARIWNHANVLVLSNRTLDEENANNILTSWFEPYDKSIGIDTIQELNKL
ncbi:MAG: RpiB/LacA/LacB family sugar-phosphate isomerase [Gammaproteobacteria bacterium]